MRACEHSSVFNKSQVQVKEKEEQESWSCELNSQWSLFLQMMPIFLVRGQQLRVKVMPVYHLTRLLSLTAISSCGCTSTWYWQGCSPAVWRLRYYWSYYTVVCHDNNSLISSECERKTSTCWNATQTHSQQCLWLPLCFLWFSVANEQPHLFHAHTQTFIGIQSVKPNWQ